jgi:hypothetical protein
VAAVGGGGVVWDLLHAHMDERAGSLCPGTVSNEMSIRSMIWQ